jgi:superfamily II DNA/RNA helicase
MRAALVEYFHDEAIIMIATEAAAEGINLQFCSLVINYDLPWNPQRIEQRIGRCHRYGQKHDVVVVNFLNKKNAADQRVYQLLDEKFKLFSGVFGASDEVLGSIGSGLDFEKRIADIYQKCRTEEQIQFNFDQLQGEMELQIDERIKQTRQKLLENFDEEVHEKLRINQRESNEVKNKFDHWLWELTRFYLQPYAKFEDGLKPDSRSSRTHFPKSRFIPARIAAEQNVDDANLYRPGHLHWRRRSVERCKREVEDRIKAVKKEARLAPNLPEKLGLERERRQLEAKRDEAWKAYEQAAKDIEGRKDDLMDEIEKRMTQALSEERLFTIRWQVQ